MVRICPFNGYRLFQNSFSSFSSNMIYPLGWWEVRKPGTWSTIVSFCPQTLVEAKKPSDDRGSQTHFFWNCSTWGWWDRTSLLFWWQSCWADLEGWLFPSHGDRGWGQCSFKKKKAEMTNRNREKYSLNSTDNVFDRIHRDDIK